MSTTTSSQRASTTAADNREPSHGGTLVERPTVTISLPAGWARAALAGIEAALVGWGLPALGAALAYLLVAGNPWLADFTIGEASRMGAQFWVASLGVPTLIGPVHITFIPLLWTLIQVVALRGFLLPTRTFGPNALWISIPSYLVSTIIIAAVAGTGVPIWQVIPGSILVASAGVLWAVAQQSPVMPRWIERWGWGRAGLRSGLRWTGLALLAGVVAVVVTVSVSWDRVQATTEALAPGAVGEWGIGTLQVLYGLVYVAWALAWLAGPGFTFVGSQPASPTAAAEASDFLPIAAAVPTSAPGAWVLWILVAVGLVAGAVYGFRVRRQPLGEAAGHGGVATVVFAALMALLMWTATGSLGVDRLASLGPRPWSWLALTGLVAVVAWAVGLALHPGTREAAVATVRSVRARTGNTDPRRGAKGRAENAGTAGKEGDTEGDQGTICELPEPGPAPVEGAAKRPTAATGRPASSVSKEGKAGARTAFLGSLRANWAKARQNQEEDA